MRLLFVSDSLKAPTGFGTQTKMIAERLVRRGHEVAVVGGTHTVTPNLTPGLTEFNSRGLDTDDIDSICESYQPNAVVFFNHYQLLHQLSFTKGIPANVPCYFWFPWEGITFPPEAASLCSYLPSERIIHLTPNAQSQWEKLTPKAKVIPHGVDLNVFHPNVEAGDLITLRRKWSEQLNMPIMDDAFILINVDRNDVRKRWDLTLDLVRRVVREFEERNIKCPIQLIAHTNPKEDTVRKSGGINLEEAIALYGLKGKVVLTKMNFDDNFMRAEEVAELFRLSDVHISTSTGEGFGIPCIEAMASGIPSIVPNHTGLSYVMAGQAGLTECAATQMTMGVLWGVPDTQAMAVKIADLAGDAKLYDTACQAAQDAAQSFDIEDVVDAWESELGSAFSEDYKGRYLYRWGYTNNSIVRRSLHAAAKISGLLAPNSRVFEAGSANGTFIDFCRAEGVQVTGQEPDVQFIGTASPQSRTFIKHQPFAATTPPADVFVMTDILDYIQSSAEDPSDTKLLENYFSRLKDYFWVMGRFETSHRWDLPMVAPELAQQMLGKTHTRRVDLEVQIRHKLPMFSHQIWMLKNSGVASDAIPNELKEFLNGTN